MLWRYYANNSRAGPLLLALGVVSANMGCKLFVALQLEVEHHFIESSAGGRVRRFESPAAFGATEILLVNPHQCPAHGHALLLSGCNTLCFVTNVRGVPSASAKRNNFFTNYIAKLNAIPKNLIRGVFLWQEDYEIFAVE